MPETQTRRTVFLAALALGATALLLAVLLRAAPIAHAQSTPAANAPAGGERWLHVAVDSKDERGDRVRINVPVSLAQTVLAAVDHGRMSHGIVHINGAHLDDIDVRSILKAVKSAPDGEFVTVEAKDTDVKVTKSGGLLLIHVVDACAHHKARMAATSGDAPDNGDASGKPNHHRFRIGCSDANGQENVDIRVPLEVADALFSGPTNELNVAAALDLLAKHKEMELVSVKDSENTVRVWMNTKTTQD